MHSFAYRRSIVALGLIVGASPVTQTRTAVAFTHTEKSSSTMNKAVMLTTTCCNCDRNRMSV